MKYSTKSLLIARLPRDGDKEFKTASIKLFKINDPHKTSELPTEDIVHTNVEKIIIKGAEVDYFLEGNDLIINNLEEVDIDHKDTIVEISVPN